MRIIAHNCWVRISHVLNCLVGRNLGHSYIDHAHRWRPKILNKIQLSFFQERKSKNIRALLLLWNKWYIKHTYETAHCAWQSGEGWYSADYEEQDSCLAHGDEVVASPSNIVKWQTNLQIIKFIFHVYHRNILKLWCIWWMETKSQLGGSYCRWDNWLGCPWHWSWGQRCYRLLLVWSAQKFSIRITRYRMRSTTKSKGSAQI